MTTDQKIQYHKDAIKKLETYEPSYTIDYLKIAVLLGVLGMVLSVHT